MTLTQIWNEHMIKIIYNVLIHEGTGKLLKSAQIRILLTDIFIFFIRGEFILHCYEQESFVQLWTGNMAWLLVSTSYLCSLQYWEIASQRQT